MTFRVGQKVVCINGAFSSEWDQIGNKPVERGIYTVRAVTICTFGSHVDVPCILLEEVKNPIKRWRDGSTMECPFAQKRFRPLVERKTDISIFKAMLTNTKISVSSS